MSKSTNGLRKVGLASLAVTLTLGAGLAGAGAANAVEDFKFDRIAGADRFDTAKRVSVEFKSLQAYDEVILVNGQRGQYADALAAAHLAGDRQIPILLTKHTETPDFTVEALEANAVKKITIVGGEGVVSAEQEAALAEDYTVTRIEGIDRYKTNAEVLKAAGTTTATTGLVAAGNNFADALAGSPVAYKGSPLGLAKVDDIDDDVKKALVDSGIKKVVILGGPTIVGPEVEAELKAAGLTVERVYGADRSETSMELADYAIENLGMTNEAANVASGSSTLYGADALSGGPLTGEENRPMLITMNVDKPGDLESWFEANANTLKEGIIFGGNGAVSTRVQELLETAASKTTSNQDYTVSGGQAQAEDAQVLQYTVSGLTAGQKVDIALVDSDDVVVGSNGQTTFQPSTNPGGTGNVYNLDLANSDITVVNGSTTATGIGTAHVDGVTVSGTSVTFSVTTDAPDDFVPVVFADNQPTAAGDNRLQLNADNTPAEDFGVGQATTVIPAEAATDNTTYTGTVAFVNKAADVFSSSAASFYYDSNDEFRVVDSSVPVTGYRTVTMAQFEELLSVDDTFTARYRTDAANQSTFTLDDVAPEAPANVSAVGTDSAVADANKGKGGVEVTFDDSLTDTVASYQVFRSTKPVPTVTGQTTECQEPGTAAYSQIGTVQDTKSTGSYNFLDSSAQPPAQGETTPIYCYYVVSVDEAGDLSEASNVDEATADKATQAQQNQAPKFTTDTVATSGTGTDQIVLDYSEAVDAGTIDVSNIPTSQEFEVRIIDGNVTTNVTANITDVAVSGDKVTLTLSESFAPADTVRVDVRNGADGNTVGEASTPSGQTKLFQSVDDAVVETAV